MKSIIKHLGGDTFPRIRVGIGGEKHPGQDLADYVLGHFKDDEKELLSDALDKAEKAAELLTVYGQSPSTAGISVGYPDLYHFSKIFKKHFGVSPREYQKLNI